MLDFSTEESKLDLRKRLYEQSLFVTFTKVDGSERTMLCTLNPKSIPQSEGSKSSRSFPTTSLAVFDIESNGWRSFRWDSIIKVNP